MTNTNIVINKYSSLVFDCDGVILNSNKIKSQAFYETANKYFDHFLAKEFLEYHKLNGGVSRYNKFDWLLSTASQILPNVNLPTKSDLLQLYKELVLSGLMNCEIEPHIRKLRSQSKAKWHVVSGGDQSELRYLFDHLNLSNLFDGGIFGSPDSKITILNREIRCRNIIKPALFLGDSKIDYISSQNSQLDFIFIQQWSEFADIKPFSTENSIKIVPSLSFLCTEKQSS